MRTLASSEDPDEMPHNAFHQGLHCLLFGKNAIQRQKILFYLEIITCDPSIYIQWTIPCLLHQTRRKNPLVLKALSLDSKVYNVWIWKKWTGLNSIIDMLIQGS